MVIGWKIIVAGLFTAASCAANAVALNNAVLSIADVLERNTINAPLVAGDREAIAQFSADNENQPLVLAAALYAAIYTNVSSSLIRCLLEGGANPNLPVPSIFPPEHPIPKFFQGYLRYPVPAFSDTNEAEDMNRISVTCLIAAIKRMRPDLVNLLLEYEANPNQQASGVTPLSTALEIRFYASHAAVGGPDQLDIVKSLLRSGANPHTRNDDPTLSRFLSTFLVTGEPLPEKFLDIFEALLEAGADIESIAPLVKTISPTICYAHGLRAVALVRILLDYGRSGRQNLSAKLLAYASIRSLYRDGDHAIGTRTVRFFTSSGYDFGSSSQAQRRTQIASSIQTGYQVFPLAPVWIGEFATITKR